VSNPIVWLFLSQSDVPLIIRSPCDLKIILYSFVQNMTVDEHGGCVVVNYSYPDCLSFNCDGPSVIFDVPQVEGNNLKSLMCIAYSSTPDNITSDGLKNVLVKNYTKATIQLYKSEALASFEDEERQRVISSLEPGNKVEVVVVLGNGIIVKKTTVYHCEENSWRKMLALIVFMDLSNVVSYTGL